MNPLERNRFIPTYSKEAKHSRDIPKQKYLIKRILCTVMPKETNRQQANLPTCSTRHFCNEMTISPENNYFTEKQRASHYIHPCTLYVGFTVRVEAS